MLRCKRRQNKVMTKQYSKYFLSDLIFLFSIIFLSVQNQYKSTTPLLHTAFFNIIKKETKVKSLAALQPKKILFQRNGKCKWLESLVCQSHRGNKMTKIEVINSILLMKKEKSEIIRNKWSINWNTFSKCLHKPM